MTGDALSAAPWRRRARRHRADDGHVAGRRRSLSMLLEIDGTDRASYNTEKFIAYDHFLAGWCLRTLGVPHRAAARCLRRRITEKCAAVAVARK